MPSALVMLTRPMTSITRPTRPHSRRILSRENARGRERGNPNPPRVVIGELTAPGECVRTLREVHHHGATRGASSGLCGAGEAVRGLVVGHVRADQLTHPSGASGCPLQLGLQPVECCDPLLNWGMACEQSRVGAFSLAGRFICAHAFASGSPTSQRSNWLRSRGWPAAIAEPLGNPISESRASF